MEYDQEYVDARLAGDLGQAVYDRGIELGLSRPVQAELAELAEVVELAEQAEVAELVELAERAGMTQPQVSRMEGGDTVPTLPVLRRLAKVLDGTLNWPSMRVTPRHLHLARRLKPTPSRSVEDSEPVSEVAPPTSWEKMSSPTSTRSTVRRRS